MGIVLGRRVLTRWKRLLEVCCSTLPAHYICLCVQMKTFRMIVLAVIAAIAIGGLSVEALRKHVWCKNRDDCPYNTECLMNMKMRKVSNSNIGGSSDDVKAGVEDVVEISLTHGKGICSEIVQFGLTLENIKNLELYSKEGDTEKRERLEVEICDDVYVLFCEDNDGCRGDGVCQEFELEGDERIKGICSDVLSRNELEQTLSNKEGSVVLDDIKSRVAVYCEGLASYDKTKEHCKEIANMRNKVDEELKGLNETIVVAEGVRSTVSEDLNTKMVGGMSTRKELAEFNIILISAEQQVVEYRLEKSKLERRKFLYSLRIEQLLYEYFESVAVSRGVVFAAIIENIVGRDIHYRLVNDSGS
eukprot:GHVS01062676.1.p1 GENE.GHVS01062676.1~~GHVS01062676.1.p1  ORF type:complete len:360 (-),score=33.86 GHVS01062676.1:230-1309(-)